MIVSGPLTGYATACSVHGRHCVSHMKHGDFPWAPSFRPSEQPTHDDGEAIRSFVPFGMRADLVVSTLFDDWDVIHRNMFLEA